MCLVFLIPKYILPNTILVCCKIELNSYEKIFFSISQICGEILYILGTLKEMREMLFVRKVTVPCECVGNNWNQIWKNIKFCQKNLGSNVVVPWTFILFYLFIFLSVTRKIVTQLSTCKNILEWFLSTSWPKWRNIHLPDHFCLVVIFLDLFHFSIATVFLCHLLLLFYSFVSKLITLRISI